MTALDGGAVDGTKQLLLRGRLTAVESLIEFALFPLTGGVFLKQDALFNE